MSICSEIRDTELVTKNERKAGMAVLSSLIPLPKKQKRDGSRDLVNFFFTMG